ncbi:MAG TPA: metallophosphoesterase [Planctomycetota bacterium]|nr:metallophosphoesterase [Planctomycetota bacterium]
MRRTVLVGAWVLALLLAARAPATAGDDVLTGVERVVAVGDVHGDYDQFVAVLRSARLLDEKGAWIGGKAHLVQTGDILDRGPDSRKAMDLLIRLEAEAARAGGAVHALIGNHEAMNLYGDLRYVSEGELAAFRDAASEKARDELYRDYQKSAKGVVFDDVSRKAWDADHPLGYAEHRRAFGPEGVYGRWIRGHHAVIRIDGTLFLHGGISPKYADWGVRTINERIRIELADFTKLEGGVVTDDEGPLWYRGLALRGRELETHVQTVLRNFGVDRIAIGHTYTEGAVLPRFGGRVLQIDVGLSKVYDAAGRSACIEIDRGKVRVLHRGTRLELPADDGLDLLRYLKQAAALDPSPSPLTRQISSLEAALAEPSKK